ncbi:protein kinase (NpkA), putative [Talaromyces stipitatus ATCC 10500]|uniref:cyclin-dependent kinase n=1 Tax=Talaromyces stipitatus (strain ATCC 10500 / CBS 375.48 / QM 6759 / NRRL 1006) TaxID=441959 RepID=B8MC85_TALSN|nr:protein kinase (NpkA), putative [Talaromyces stipitatus ATCC 10500]EED18531.1 protein kinase (NpkA), putative [Talaromyces stipitatus ATCC 10500]
MSSKSRWAAEDPEEEAAIAQRKREKEAKKRAKAERQRLEEQQKQAAAATAAATGASEDARPTKRRRLSIDGKSASPDAAADRKKLLRFPSTEWAPCRHVDNYERLNHIEEGSYGVVSRARDLASGEIVALKKLKIDNAPDGFPVTGLREIQTLQRARHVNIVNLREIVMGNSMKDVYLVMDFLEHDLKTLLDDMPEPFLPSEIKTLLQQIFSATEFLHANWILHRDLKTSNLLLNNRGEIKLADFGMARYFGDPKPAHLTQLVVTLWYRSPELLLGAERYGAEIDMWSVGCIFGELLRKEPLFTGKNEVDQLAKIFAITGPPTQQSWPTFRSLPNAKSLRLPPSSSSSNGSATPLLPRSQFPYLTNAGLNLLSSLLALNPSSRPTAAECLRHAYFREDPRPKAKEMFPTFPSKAGQEKRRRKETPEAPRYGEEAPKLDFADAFGGASSTGGKTGAGFTLRLG